MEFEVEGVTYRADKMGAVREFNVCRRLLGALKTLDTNALSKVMKPDAKGEDQMALMMSVASYIGEAPQADVDFILNTTLPFVKKNEGGKWVAVAAQNGALMDDGLSMMALVMILWNALKGPVEDFLRRAMPTPSSSPAAEDHPTPA